MENKRYYDVDCPICYYKTKSYNKKVIPLKDILKWDISKTLKDYLKYAYLRNGINNISVCLNCINKHTDRDLIKNTPHKQGVIII